MRVISVNSGLVVVCVLSICVYHVVLSIRLTQTWLYEGT